MGMARPGAPPQVAYIAYMRHFCFEFNKKSPIYTEISMVTFFLLCCYKNSSRSQKWKAQPNLHLWLHFVYRLWPLVTRLPQVQTPSDQVLACALCWPTQCWPMLTDVHHCNVDWCWPMFRGICQHWGDRPALLSQFSPMQLYCHDSYWWREWWYLGWWSCRWG